MPLGAEDGGPLQLNQLLQAVRTSSGISSPAVLPSSSGTRAEAPELDVGVVCLA